MYISRQNGQLLIFNTATSAIYLATLHTLTKRKERKKNPTLNYDPLKSFEEMNKKNLLKSAFENPP